MAAKCFLDVLRSNVSSGLTFVALLFIGIWGRQSGWTFTRVGQNVQSSDSPRSLTPIVADSTETTSIARSTQPMPQGVSIHSNGVIGYDQTKVAKLSAKVRGTVRQVEKKVGQQVRKGDVLAIIESAAIGQAKSALLTAVSRLQSKEKLYDCMHKLDGVVAMRQIIEAESALRDAKIGVSVAQQALVNLGLPILIEELKELSPAEMWSRVQFLGLPDQITARLDAAVTGAGLIPLVAPFDGTVLVRNVALGEIVDPSQTQFIVADLREMWVRLDVQVDQASRVRLGQEVLFRLDAASEEVRGQVDWISTELDAKTRTVPVRVVVPNPLVVFEGDGRRLLHAHFYGTGVIQLDKAPAADPTEPVRCPPMVPVLDQTVARRDGWKSATRRMHLDSERRRVQGNELTRDANSTTRRRLRPNSRRGNRFDQTLKANQIRAALASALRVGSASVSQTSIGRPRS